MIGMDSFEVIYQILEQRNWGLDHIERQVKNHHKCSVHPVRGDNAGREGKTASKAGLFLNHDLANRGFLSFDEILNLIEGAFLKQTSETLELEPSMFLKKGEKRSNNE